MKAQEFRRNRQRDAKCAPSLPKLNARPKKDNDMDELILQYVFMMTIFFYCTSSTLESGSLEPSEPNLLLNIGRSVDRLTGPGDRCPRA